MLSISPALGVFSVSDSYPVQFVNLLTGILFNFGAYYKAQAKRCQSGIYPAIAKVPFPYNALLREGKLLAIHGQTISSSGLPLGKRTISQNAFISYPRDFASFEGLLLRVSAYRFIPNAIKFYLC